MNSITKKMCQILGHVQKIKRLKLKGFSIILTFMLFASQTIYAATYSASSFEEYKHFLIQGLTGYENNITIKYSGNERFSEKEVGDQLVDLYYESVESLNAFDKQNIYNIGGSFGKDQTNRSSEYFLRIGQYEIEYKNSVKELQEADIIINNALNSIIMGNNSDYEKVKAIYDYVLITLHYEKLAAEDTDEKNLLLERNLLRGLQGGGAVCDTYAMLLSKMLTKQGFDNIMIVGNTEGNQLHVWNRVKLNDAWYNIDATWGDTGKAENKSKYFLVSDKVLLDNRHTWDMNEYPSASLSYTDFMKASVKKGASPYKK